MIVQAVRLIRFFLIFFISNAMEEEEENSYIIACRIDKALINPDHVIKIQDAVQRCQHATLLATQLLGYHARKCLERGLNIPNFGDGNWVKKAWNVVTQSTRVSNNRIDDPEMLATLNEFMPEAAGAVDSKHIAANVLQGEANRWSVVASTNAFTHFRKRVQAFIMTNFKLSNNEFDLLTPVQKQNRKRELLQVAADVCRPEGDDYLSDVTYHDFVDNTRRIWELDIFPWDGKPLEYHAKSNPSTKMHLLLRAMWIMSMNARKPFALLPLRTNLVPRHVGFDATATRDVLQLGTSAYKKQRQKEAYQNKKRMKLSEAMEDDDLGLPPLTAQQELPETVEENTATHIAGNNKKRRRPKSEVNAEKEAELSRIFDLRKAGIKGSQLKQFTYSFTSDGVAIHLIMKQARIDKGKDTDAFPRRGCWHLDELKRRLRCGEGDIDINDDLSPESKLKKLCTNDVDSVMCGECEDDSMLKQPIAGKVVIGGDPGRQEPINLCDPITHRKLRMTAAHRQFMTKPAHYNLTPSQMSKHGHDRHQKCINAKLYHAKFVQKPEYINQLESEIGQLCKEGNFCSKSPWLEDFHSYITTRKERLAPLLAHYNQLHHRRLRFKAYIARQRFDDQFIRDLKQTFAPNNEQIIIAWGMYGLVAGRPGTVGNRGRAPTIGVGLAKRIAREDNIIVAWTPEHYTTKTCFHCGGECGRCKSAEIDRARTAGFRHEIKEVRGIRVCNNPACKKHLVRDLNAAKNIAVNCLLILFGCAPIRKMTDNEATITSLAA